VKRLIVLAVIVAPLVVAWRVWRSIESIVPSDAWGSDENDEALWELWGDE